jgi:predicted RNA-binding protein with PUA-like domain
VIARHINVARWLVKTEPGTYSWDDLARDKSTVWDGISNHMALKHVRSMKKGDEVFVYHTGDEKAVVGTASVGSNPYPDPNQNDERIAVVELRTGRKLARPVTLAEIKADPAFKDFALVRISRLSVMPVPDPMWDRILSMAGNNSGQQQKPKKEARRR